MRVRAIGSPRATQGAAEGDVSGPIRNPDVRTHRDLVVWRKSLLLAATVYRLTARFPPDERFGLTAQLRRAAVSVASNIAEGGARGRPGDFINGLRIARGSLAEVETQLQIAAQIAPDLDLSDAQLLIRDIERMLSGLIASLRVRARLAAANAGSCR